ncbi:MAG: NAD-dependent epimerase/dehydratase family protein [Bacteroidia bacterium]
MQKVVVTGASGHIGYHVASQLLALNYDVLLLIRKENQNINDLKNKGAKILIADLQNSISYKNEFENTDALFHIASENTTDTSDEQRVIANTFSLTKNVIDAAIEKNVKTIIYTSSVVVLGRSSNPEILINENNKTTVLESPYVKGKFLAEEYCDKIIKEKKS